MTRLLTTTAVLLSMSGAAFAEAEATKPVADPVAGSSMEAPATATDPVATDPAASATAPDSAMANEMGIAAAEASITDFYASDLIGMRVYNVEADYDMAAPLAAGGETEWDDIGEINDIVVTADGKVSAVILGIGGFLGIGERDVAVNMGAINVLTQDGDANDRFLVVQTSKEELEQLTEFTRDDL